jgi:glycosyltransferase involved in cell wall biosynthesis
VLIDPDDPLSIAEGLAKVLTNERFRHELVLRGFARVKQLTWKASAERLISVYRRIESARG